MPPSVYAGKGGSSDLRWQYDDSDRYWPETPENVGTARIPEDRSAIFQEVPGFPFEWDGA